MNKCIFGKLVDRFERTHALNPRMPCKRVPALLLGRRPSSLPSSTDRLLMLFPTRTIRLGF